jgi:hypothetical protein
VELVRALDPERHKRIMSERQASTLRAVVAG